MTISRELLREAVESISAIKGLHMDVAALVEDTIMLSRSFPEISDFTAACANTHRALVQLVGRKVSSSGLEYDFSGWSSYHYQHRVGQGAKADCRIIYRRVEGGIEVKGFGHRHVPEDIYERMAGHRKGRE